MPHTPEHKKKKKKKEGIVVTEPKEERVFTDPETGRTSGATIDDRTFFGLTAGDLELLLRQRKEKEAKLTETTAFKERIELSEKIPSVTETLEQAGAFEEVTPRRTELSPDLKTDIPFLTPALAAASQVAKPRSVLGIARDRGFFPNLLPTITTGEEAFPIPETPETLREAALRQISINQFNEGVTEAERGGAFLETLPGFGVIDKWVSGVVEAPFGNAEDVLTEIKDIGDQATNAQEKTRSGIMPPAFALDKARKSEDRIASLEGRLKLLVSQSKILLANTDQVNLWEAEILDGKERIDNLRTAASFSLTAELTGTGRIIPTDEQIFFELKEQQEKIETETLTPTQLEPRKEQVLAAAIPVGVAAARGAAVVIPRVLAKFGGKANVPAIFERVAKFPTITKRLLDRGTSKLYDEIGRFTDKGLEALEKFLK